MTSPNGMGSTDLADMLNRTCRLEGEFVLASGAKSSTYFDCKRALLSWHPQQAIAMQLGRVLDDMFGRRPLHVAGVTVGGALMCSTALTLGSRISASVVRTDRKDHGTKALIENDIGGRPVVLVEDTITSGESIASAGHILEDAGYTILGGVAVIDREAGGMDHLRRSFGGEWRALVRMSELDALTARQGE